MNYKTLSIETDGILNKTIVKVDGAPVSGLTAIRFIANIKKNRVVITGKIIDTEATKEQQKIVKVPVVFIPETVVK
jgi:hypothetical protein